MTPFSSTFLELDTDFVFITVVGSAVSAIGSPEEVANERDTWLVTYSRRTLIFNDLFGGIYTKTAFLTDGSIEESSGTFFEE